MTTAEELREMAKKLRAAAKKLRAEAILDDEQAAMLEKMASEQEDEMRAVDMPLTSSHRPSTVEDVSTELSSNALRSQAQIADDVKKHRLVVVMAKRGLSFADVAAALEERLKRSFPRSTVQSWVKPKTNPSWRGIPQDAADALKALYGVPLSAWARIIPG